MKHGLMGKDKIENLGYTAVNNWDNEENVSILSQLIFYRKRWIYLGS